MIQLVARTGVNITGAPGFSRPSWSPSGVLLKQRTPMPHGLDFFCTLVAFPSRRLFAARQLIVDLAGKHRLPTMSISGGFVQLAGFIAYGMNFPDSFRRATYVDQILQRAESVYLPVEQPANFECRVSADVAIRTPHGTAHCFARTEPSLGPSPPSRIAPSIAQVKRASHD